MSQFLEAALAYRRAGLHPIPLEPKGKRPIVNWKEYQDRQPTEAEIKTWWRAEQTEDTSANVGLVLGRGMYAVDIDSVEGRENLLAAGVELPDTAPSVTTGKGAHVYLAGTAPDRVGVVPGVDIRGVGYCVAPPSIHPSGAEYRWVVPMAGTPPPAPPALRALLERRAPSVASAEPGMDWVAEALQGVSEGGRNATCARLAGYFLGKGLSVGVVTQLLEDWAERCDPPYRPDEAGNVPAAIVQRIAQREGEHTEESALPAPISTAVAEAMVEIGRSAEERKKHMRSTEFAVLDDLLGGGFEPDDYTIVGGRPGTGKTIFGLQVSRKTAEEGRGVLYVSREMRASKLVRRLLVQVSGVRASDVKAGTVVPAQRASLEFAASHLNSLPIWITNARTVDQLSEIVAGFDPGVLGLVVVDYLQLLGGPSDMRDKRALVEHNSKALKDITTRFQIPVLCLSSLRRLGRKKDGEREKADMSDLRESGELEHDADNVIILTRDFDSDVCEATLSKARDGRVGSVEMRFRGDLMRFEEIRK